MSQHIISEEQSRRVRQLATGQTGTLRTHLLTQHRGRGPVRCYMAIWRPDDEFLERDQEDGEYASYSEQASFTSVEERDAFLKSRFADA